LQNIVERLLNGDRRALARMVTLIENESPVAHKYLAEIHQHTGNAHLIGVTGAPGAGKSTLVTHLVRELRKRGHKIGVVAVDPSSPFSGGAILGDRIRMDELDVADEVFIRSIASRGTSDGLADNLPEMLDAMDDFDFDEVLLETVGVGQAEYAVKLQVDTLVLVVLPDSGDMVQAMKAGIAELADIFVVNKADLPGASRMLNDIQRIASIQRYGPDEWKPPVLLTSVSDPKSIESLSDAIDRHQDWAASKAAERLIERSRYNVRRIVERRTARFLSGQGTEFFEAPLEIQLAKIATELRGASSEDEKSQ